jgi:chemotaxis signal transduction protein
MTMTTEDVSAHMRRVQIAERDLRDLGMVWRTIESSAAISCPAEVAPILPTLVGTRERFEALQTRLVDQMATESQAALGDELTAKAQCAIDILVRNLYERTADVGFLATDPEVRRFCALPTAERTVEQAALLGRLRAYQAKYTVYDDIVLLGTGGEVLARLDTEAPLAHSHEPLLARALAAPGHVERFGPTDLQPGGHSALMYAHRIGGEHGQALGVLVLRFRFADEMARIFDGVADARHEMAIVLLGDDQRVIATADEAHVPLGAKLARVDPGGVSLTTFSGREYLAVCCASHGYQGYAGPAWRAQAMVSLLTAFRERQTFHQNEAHTNIPLEHEALLAINRDADEINRDLRRVVWNGRLMAASADGDRLRLKAVLGQVNVASVRTRQRVNQAIQDLAHTALTRSRLQSDELARLAADIMDRNLYERANDCRWWALSPALQQALGEDTPDASAVNTVLDQVNSLYTVYSRLVLFNADGRICGASRAADMQGLVGSTIDPRWLGMVKALRDPQQYAVSDFEDTPLHAAGPTYTYLAAVHAPEGGPVLGGLAIVFNAAQELHTMLREVLGERPGFAAFLNSQGQVLAATDPALASGLPFQLAGGHGTFEYQAAHHVGTQVRACGYREFKAQDGYDNQVSAIVGLRLGATERRRAAFSDIELSGPPAPARRPIELAVFQVGAMRYGLPAAAVMEAVSRHGLVPTPGRDGAVLGMLEVQSGGQARLVRVLCARQLFGVGYSARTSDGVVLVLRDPQRPDRPAVGLRVDDVLSVLEFDAQRQHAAPSGFSNFAPWVNGLLECQAVQNRQPMEVLIQLLDAGLLMGGHATPAPAVASAVAAETALSACA